MLQQVACQLCQIAPFPLYQVYMDENVLSIHPVGEVGQSVRLLIEIRRINLVQVAGKQYPWKQIKTL